jgi:hypothetical protein
MKRASILIVMLIVMASFSQCLSSKELQPKDSNTYVFHAFKGIDNIYYQSWIAGIEGGGSGINIFITTNDEIPEGLILDSVYFRGKAAKLEVKPNDKMLYIGRFKTGFNVMKQVIVMSSDSKEEYGNQLPKVETKTPFDLKDNECVVSYKKGDETQYYKIENIIEKQAQHFPSAPPNKQ